MNKLFLSFAILSSAALFNTYSSLAQAADKSEQKQLQTTKQDKHCNANSKESCCKADKPANGNCCACCGGANCTAKQGTHCCG